MEELNVVKQSYGRCCLKPQFIDRFYELFLQSHPAIKPMFAKTDFAKQKQLLKTGLAMLISHVEGKPMGTMTLDRIAKSHSKNQLNIDPNLYQYWIQSLVAAVKECDPKFDATLQRGWEKVLRAGVDHITAQYSTSET